jgi:hypothetical protein
MLNVSLDVEHARTGSHFAGRAAPTISIVANDQPDLVGLLALYLTTGGDGENVTAWAHLSPEQAVVIAHTLLQGAEVARQFAKQESGM